MTQDEEIVLSWMLKMTVKEKNYPELVEFWIEAIQEKLMEIVNRDQRSEIPGLRTDY